jgi:DNA-binding transcriptional regulator YdaS (Cro superfamily)
MGRIGFRQALAEVVAVNLAGVNTSRLNTWRSLGRAPRAERLSMVEAAAEHANRA